MKLISILSILFSVSFASADQENPDFTRWRFGIGFTQQSQMRSGLTAELSFPTFSDANAPTTNSIVVSYGFTATDLEKPGDEPYLVGTGRVMFENRYQFYKELISFYGRIGGGYTHMNKSLHSDGGIIILPIQIGIDLVVRKGEGAMSTFFIQVGQDTFISSVEDEIARRFDGTQFTLGGRFTF